MIFRQSRRRRANSDDIVGSTPSAGADESRVDFLRRLYSDIFEWYKLADSKAQLILTLDGVFISFFAAAILGDPQQFAARAQAFGPETWTFLTLASLAVLTSIASALMCLRSRLHGAHLKRILGRYRLDPARPETYAPVSWWFGTIAVLDPKVVIDVLARADSTFETDALASQVPVFSRNVLQKHRWANHGWLLAGAGLGFLLASIASLIIRS